MANTPLRNVRVPDDVWEAAKARAEAEGSSVSAVVVAALRRYGKTQAGHGPVRQPLVMVPRP